MNPTREEQLFELALGQPAAERAAFLARECGDDVGMCRRIEARLLAQAETDSLQATRLEAAGGTGLPDATNVPDEGVGWTSGRYKLVEKLGEGGCGVVYVAEQTEPVRRQVALKVIKLGMDTRQVVARFEAERQAVAMMDHPNIAKVLDAGTTETGRPYFVMELVRGIRITDYCDQHKLSTRERLELFIKVCQAIQHAHQKGIIHRDIKPSNILVSLHDGQPAPKVIDFGIAKATEGRLTDATVHTQLHQFVGTPGYMSPEQAGANREDVDTRSDIYSLGVLLYELLAGRTPFDAKKLLAGGYEAILRTIREEEPPKLSTSLSTLTAQERGQVAACRQATPERLSRALRGELDWVVMKALEKDRARRYATAAAFADDLNRYLRREPVAAAPPSFVYRARRFVTRNLTAVAVASVVTLLLLTSTALAIRSARVEGRQRRELAVQRDFATNQAALAREANEKAQRTLGELSETLSQLELQKVSQLLEPGSGGPADVGLAVAYLARSIRQNPSDFRAVYRLMSLLMQRDFARPLRERSLDAKILDFIWTGNGLLLATAPTNDVAGANGGRVTFVDFESGQPALGPILDGAGVDVFNFSASGRRFWTSRSQPGSNRQQLLVGEVATGRALGPAITVEGWISRVVFDETEERILVQSQSRGLASRAQRIEVFEVASGRSFGKPYEGSELGYGAPAFEGDRRRLILPGNAYNSPPRYYDLERGAVEEPSPQASDRFNSLLRRLRSASRDQVTYLGPEGFTLSGLFGGATVIVPVPGRQGVRALSSPDGRRLALAGTDSSNVMIWSIASTRARSLPLPRPEGSPRMDVGASAAMDAGGRRVARVIGTNVAVWDVRRGQRPRTFSVGSDAEHLRLSPDAEWVLAIRAGAARLYSAADGRPHGAEFGRGANSDWLVSDAEFSSDSRRVLTWSASGKGRLWSVESLTPVGVFGPHEAEGATAHLSADARRAVTHGSGTSAQVWDLAAGSEACRPLRHAARVNAAEFTPDGETLVTGSDDGTAQVWSVRDGSRLTPPLRHGGRVLKVVVLPHSARIATAGEGREVKLWDLRSGNLAQTIELDRDQGSGLVSAAGGRLLLNVGYQTRVYDPATLVPLSDVLGVATRGESVPVSREGDLVVSFGDAGPVVNALPSVTVPAPSWLPELAEAIVARRFTRQGVAESIAFAEAKQTLERFRTAPGDDPFSRWVRWQLASGPDRAVNPAVELSESEFVRLAAGSEDDGLIQPALELDSNNVALLEAVTGPMSASMLQGASNIRFGDEDSRMNYLISEAVRGLALAGRLLELSSNSIPAWHLKAVAHARLQETNQALEALGHMTRAPTNSREWWARAFVLEAAQRIDEAEIAYRQAAATEGPALAPQRLGPALDARLAFLRRHGRREAALREQLAASGIAPRGAGVDARLLDLGPHYTGSLAKPFVVDYGGDDLLELTPGVQTYADVPFDVRGVLARPASGIAVQRTVRRLHFLQGSTSLWLGPTNTLPVGVFVVHYADGQRAEVSVVGGRHVRDWFVLPDEPVGVPDAELAWMGGNERSRRQEMRLRLFKMTWQNPRPDVAVAKIDFDRLSYGEGLFVLGITADDGTIPPGPPGDPFVRAEIAEATGRADETLALVENELKGRPTDSRLLLMKARALVTLGRAADAVEVISPLLARADANPRVGLDERRKLLRFRSACFKALRRDGDALADSLAAMGIPVRDANAPAALLDLSSFYNASLADSWHPGRAMNDLAALPVGLQVFSGVRFDIRGVVQLAGQRWLKGTFPTAQTNLPVGRAFKRLHALHATGWSEKTGAKIATLRLRFSDGRQHEFPIVFGEDVRDWNAGSDPTETLRRGKVAWRGRNRAGIDVRLFLSTWENPFPEAEVRAIDYVSAESNCAPFLVALTQE